MNAVRVLLCPEMLHNPMQTVNNDRKYGPDTILDNSLKTPNCLLLAHLQHKPLHYFLHHPLWLSADIGNISIDHQPEQIEHETALLAQRRISRKSVLLKAGPVLSLLAAHPVRHLGTELHQRRKGLRIAPEDIPEVGVEEVSGWRQK